MKSHSNHIILVTLLIVCGVNAAVFAQDVNFYYVAPTAQIQSNFGTPVDNSQCPVGYGKVQIDSANSATFLGIAPTWVKYVYQNLQPGNNLRTQVSKVLRISGNTIPLNYYLVDDQTSFGAGTSGIFLLVPFDVSDGYDGKRHVWPTGGSGGRIRLGEYQMENDQSKRPGNANAVDELVLHETTHTQFIGEWSRWDGYITYGQDEQHYGNELQGDPEAAFNEGVATFYGYTLNASGIAASNTFHSRTDDRYFVENRSVVAGQPSFFNNAPSGINGTVSGVAVRRYTWLQIPGFYVPWSENTSTAYLTHFWLNANGDRDQALDMIISASNAMYDNRLKRFLTYVANRLALSLEDFAATPAGQAARTNNTLSSSLFPYALLDFMTHYGMTEQEFKEDHDRHYPDRNPQAYSDYWAHRDAIKALVRDDMNASPIRFTEAITKIHDYCKLPQHIVTP
jgi:hypothetical protein